MCVCLRGRTCSGVIKKVCGWGVGRIQQPAVLLHTLQPGPTSGPTCHPSVICSITTVVCVCVCHFLLFFFFGFTLTPHESHLAFPTSTLECVCLRARSPTPPTGVNSAALSHLHPRGLLGDCRSGQIDRLSCLLPLSSPSSGCHNCASFPQGVMSESTPDL